MTHFGQRVELSGWRALIVIVMVVVGICALVVGLAVLPATTSNAPPRSAVRGATAAPVAVLQVDRPVVEVRKRGARSYRVATDGQKMHMGDTVRTGNGSGAEVDYSDGSLTRLGPATEFTVARLTEERGGHQTRGSLTVGQTWSRAAKVTETGSFEVTAGQTTAAVEGTAFAFSCTASGTRTCTVVDVVDDVDVTTTGGARAQLVPATSVDSLDDQLGSRRFLTRQDLLNDPFIVMNLLRDQAAGKGLGLGDLPAADTTTSGAGAESTTSAPTTVAPPTTAPTTTVPSPTTAPTTTVPPPTTSPPAPECRNGGHLALVGAAGETFASEADCVAFRVAGGEFATGIVIPAGQVATISDAAFAACDELAYGYQLNFGSTVQLDSKPQGCEDVPVNGTVIGPFPTAVLLRISLLDTGWPDKSAFCSDTFFSDGGHALVTGSGPWTVDVMDGNVCTSTAADPRPVSAVGAGNLRLTITLSTPAAETKSKIVLTNRVPMAASAAPS
jgi:FecR protein